MKSLCNLLLIVCLLGLAVGLLDIGNSMVSGLARAVGTIFFILFFITRMFEAFSAEQPEKH